MKKFADYIYSNTDDTIRIRIFKTGIEWDYDIITKDGIETFSLDAGELFQTKKEAKKYAESQYGQLTPNNKLDTLTEGW